MVPKTTKSPPAPSVATEDAAAHTKSQERAAPRRRSALPRAAKRSAKAGKEEYAPRRVKRTPRRASVALEASRSERPSRKVTRKSTQRPRAGAPQMRRARVEVHTRKRKAAKAPARSD
jgi:hypothetical protein